MLSRISKAFTRIQERKFNINTQRRNASYLFHPGNPVWSNRRYEEFARAYSENVIVIATTAASIPTKLHDCKKGRDILINSHPVTVLKNPNLEQNGTDFLECLYTYRLISGNVFIFGEANNECAETNFKTLRLLRPDTV